MRETTIYNALIKLNNWDRKVHDDMSISTKDRLEKKNAMKEKKRNEESNPMNPLTVLRTLVSQKKRRFIGGGFNLDLTYITNYVIACGFPAGGVESSFRNNREDFIKFLKNRHGVCVKIYNLCLESSKQYH